MREKLRHAWLWLGNPLDGTLLRIVCALLILSLVVIYSAAPDRLPAQIFNICIALVMLRFVAGMAPEKLLRLAVPLFLFSLLLLVTVALFGDISKGARRWLNLGMMRIQPSELMKIAMPLMLVWFYQQRSGAARITDHILATLLLLIPVVLIVRQPDLGTAALVFASGLYVIFLAGLSWRLIATLLLSAAISLPFFWHTLHDYQRSRILTFLAPEQDPLGRGFHIIQSTIAIGAGGIFGSGWGQGTQSQLEFIPERHTDFILAVLAEEWGLIGIILLLTLYLLLIGRGLVIAANAPSPFMRLLAGAVTLTLFTYAFVNIGMVAGMLPVVGVPLPLVSYGGTSLVTLMCSVGILMAIQRRRL